MTTPEQRAGEQDRTREPADAKSGTETAIRQAEEMASRIWGEPEDDDA